jgi:TRAP-type mannitol/chloroaromatic compound transport system permease large subunit
MAMAAYYLKGVAPPSVLLTQIFGGCMPYLFVIIFCMTLVYMFPGIITWLPGLLYRL